VVLGVVYRTIARHLISRAGLAHLERTAPQQHQTELPLGARAPPWQARLP
jgi:hypothetical protein